MAAHSEHEPATIPGSADILVRSLGRSLVCEHYCRPWVIMGARADRNVRAPVRGQASGQFPLARCRARWRLGRTPKIKIKKGF